MSNSPSSSSILSPPLNPSLPELPVELLRQIMESSVPSYYHFSTYDDRQAILRNLCLTSRLFREIAQPILERIDYVCLLHEGESVEQVASTRASRTQVLSIRARVEMPLERSGPFFIAYAHLKELHLDADHDEFRNVNLSLLAALPRLDSLTINRANLTFTTPRPLLALKHVTLTQCNGTFDALLTQSPYFPSLKVLALLDNEQHHDTVDNTDLLSRLDLFIGKPRSLKEEVLKAHADKVLSAYPYDEDISAFPGHLNIPHFRLRASDVDIETVDQVADLDVALNEIRGFINFSSTSLETLFLDEGLRDALDPFRFTQATYDALIDRCEECGTEVILEEQAVLDFGDSAITPELLRWMDRRKEKARSSLEGGIERETR